MPNNMAYNDSRPSIDSVYKLLSGLDDNQAEDLLRDLNHTAPSNVPVAEALDFFEGPITDNINNDKAGSNNDASSPTSPTTRPARRRTTFLKSVSTFDLRSSRASTKNNNTSSEPEPPLPTTTTGSPRARSASAVHHEDEEAQRRQKDQRFKTPRAYKRISRPWATLAPPSSGGPDVRDLLMAYLSPGSPPSSASSFSPASSPSSSSCSSFSTADSPATPRSTATSSSLFYPGAVVIAPMGFDGFDNDDDAPTSLADLLEPSPSRSKPRFAGFPSSSSSSSSTTTITTSAGGLGRPAVLAPQQQQQCVVGGGSDNISGIFEVLSGGS